MDERYTNADFIAPINPMEKHCASVLICDKSGSTKNNNGNSQLNEGLVLFGEEIRKHPQASGTIDVEILSFDDTVHHETPFCPVSQYVAPTLHPGGCTALNQALIEALHDIRERKDQYRATGTQYWRPLLFLITDGMPTDSEYEAEAKRLLNEAYAAKGVILHVMAIGDNADIEHLRSYLPNGKGKVLKVDACDFTEAMVWYSNSMVKLSQSDPNIDGVTSLPTPACMKLC